MTTPSTTIEELVGRVEAATGPDRKLDVALHAHFFPESFDGSADHYAAVGYLNAADRRYVDSFVPFYSQSIDADLALVDNLLPGTWYVMAKGQTRPDEALFAHQILDVGEDRQLGIGEGPTQHLAILSALLRALRIKGDHNDEA